jgi:hypothetical protein
MMSPGSGNTIATVIVTGAETGAAIHRAARVGSLSLTNAQTAITTFSGDFPSGYRLIGVTLRLIERAMTLTGKHGLRGYDAVQLAAAIELREQLLKLGAPPPTFVSADGDLNDAAKAEGFVVEDPNDYP